MRLLPPRPTTQAKLPEHTPDKLVWTHNARRRLAGLLFCAALGGTLWRMPQPAAPVFSPPTAGQPSILAASFSSKLLPPTNAAAEPTLTLLPDGRIAAAWSAARPDQTGQRDIWFSVQEEAGWRAPQHIASRESTAAGTFTHVGELGSPLLYAEGGWLHLWYASRDGLAGATLNHSVSTNVGQSWSPPEKLEIAALAAGDLIFNSPPQVLGDGGLGLALSRRGIIDASFWLRLSATGKILDQQRLPLPTPSLQPSVVALDDQRALALLRDAGPGPGQVRVATTHNGGARWQAGPALPLANPNSPLALLRLSSGRLLLAANPASGRASLQLWLSADAGQTWQRSRLVEEAADGAADFSQPALLLGHDGWIHLAYAWRRQGIKYARFSEAWLDGGSP